MKHISLVLICCILSVSQSFSQGIDKHGIVLGGGLGSINKEYKPFINNVTKGETKYKSSIYIGYKFRMNSSESFFLDVDLNLGVKMWKSSFKNNKPEPPIYEASSEYYYISTNGSINYLIYKGLSVGVGIEPTYYFYTDGEKSKNKFDTPIIGKVAYDFGKFELGIGYKHGLFSPIKTDYFKSGKFRDVQVSLFIPF